LARINVAKDNGEWDEQGLYEFFLGEINPASNTIRGTVKTNPMKRYGSGSPNGRSSMFDARGSSPSITGR